MGENSNKIGQAEARAMIEVFASVGAARFDVTRTTRVGENAGFQRGVSLRELRLALPTMLDETERQGLNLIVRPHGPGITFIQLDDLKAAQLVPLDPPVFLSLQTSPGNFQAWVALTGVGDKDFARRLRKGVGADATASGATRMAGSLNFKDKYAPNFPRVEIAAAQPGRRTTPAELERLGLVAPPEIVTPSPPRLRPTGSNRRWPSYARCLDGAPLNSEETGPDTSRADFVWCMTALTWGWTKDETAERLMEESPKAQINGRDYADLTARNAALAVERRGQQPRQHQRGDAVDPDL